MKKITSFILCLVLILSISACAKESSITGTWYSDMYMNVLIAEINEGGIYTMELKDDAMIGTWVLEDNILYLDKGTAGEATFNYDADAQTLSQSGFIFAREKIKTFKPGKAVKADVEDFAGSWTAAKVDTSDAALPLNPAAYYMSAMIDGNHVILTESADKVISEAEAVFDKGTLQLTIPAADESGKESIYTITMLKKGMLCIATDTAKYYLEKNTPEI